MLIKVMHYSFSHMSNSKRTGRPNSKVQGTIFLSYCRVCGRSIYSQMQALAVGGSPDRQYIISQLIAITLFTIRSVCHAFFYGNVYRNVPHCISSRNNEALLYIRRKKAGSQKQEAKLFFEQSVSVIWLMMMMSFFWWKALGRYRICCEERDIFCST